MRSSTTSSSLGQLVHDLRNPLNTLSMNLELMTLMSDDAPADGAQADEHFGNGLAAMERAVEELERGLARIDAYAAHAGDDGSPA